MADNCRHCVVRGDIKKCKSTDCYNHESWIDVWRIKRISELEAEVERLKTLTEDQRKLYREVDKDRNETRFKLHRAEEILRQYADEKKYTLENFYLDKLGPEQAKQYFEDK